MIRGSGVAGQKPQDALGYGVQNSCPMLQQSGVQLIGLVQARENNSVFWQTVMGAW